MNNRNNTIEERLQIINDYIQRTMDALNATRQVVQGLSSTTTNYQQQGFVPPQVGGISHSSFVPQLVQTPYGIVAINAQVPQFQGQLPVNYGFGLQHTSFVPQVQGWPMNVGLPQIGLQQLGLPQVGMNYGFGWNNGLQHTSFVPNTISPWNVPVVAQWPMQQMQQNLGFVPNNVVQQPTNVPGQTF